ncbi:hypothetical protein B296_00026685 [Ensete ventricosum]|uniref:Uncharacterized protein n=1 Tax=Ensete ventricosum TaxID=4639 RepID=A0A426X2V2_ENSVE|nr:hypothetical protein B296_00026685 [Ensete ventricosum]
MVTGHPYLRSLLCMLLTMSSYFVAASVVLAVGHMTADPPMLMSGWAQSRRVGHIVGPAVRGCKDMAARPTFVISSPPEKTFSRRLIWVPKKRSYNEPSGYSEDWLVFDQGEHRMDLGELRGMPKVSGGKAPSTRTVAPAREVVTSPARETSKASSKRPIDASTK